MRKQRKLSFEPEDLVLYALMIGIGIIPVSIAILTRVPFGFDATLGLMMVVVGALGLLYHRLRARP